MDPVTCPLWLDYSSEPIHYIDICFFVHLLFMIPAPFGLLLYEAVNKPLKENDDQYNHLATCRALTSNTYS